MVWVLLKDVTGSLVSGARSLFGGGLSTSIRCRLDFYGHFSMVRTLVRARQIQANKGSRKEATL